MFTFKACCSVHVVYASIWFYILRVSICCIHCSICVFMCFDFDPFLSLFVVLQLCYNQLSGSIPTQLGSLKKLTVLALQSNQLTGAIPASLGDLEMLMMLDLSFNRLFGSIPTKLADIPQLEVLDVRNNTLSGNVPPGKSLFFHLHINRFA